MKLVLESLERCPIWTNLIVFVWSFSFISDDSFLLSSSSFFSLTCTLDTKNSSVHSLATITQCDLFKLKKIEKERLYLYIFGLGGTCHSEYDVWQSLPATNIKYKRIVVKQILTSKTTSFSSLARSLSIIGSWNIIFFWERNSNILSESLQQVLCFRHDGHFFPMGILNFRAQSY